MNNGPDDTKEKDTEKKKPHRRRHTDNKSEKKNAPEKKHHHHKSAGKSASDSSADDKKRRHRHTKKSIVAGKPTGLAPVPQLAERIVTELHAAPKPTSIAPDTTKIAAPVHSASTPTVAVTTKPQSAPIGYFAKAINWLKESLFKPTFSRQQQLTSAYSIHFLTTLHAVQKRFSANDESPAGNTKFVQHASLKFSGKTENPAPENSTAPEVNAVGKKPTIH